MIAPSRRGLLGAVADLSASGAQTTAKAGSPTALPADATPHPDAELIAMGAEAVRLAADYRRYTAAFLALPKGSPDTELEHAGKLADPAFDRLDEMLTEAIGLRATTPEGVLGKAQVLRFWIYFDAEHNGGAEPIGFMSTTDELAWSLLLDMTGGSAAA